MLATGQAGRDNGEVAHILPDGDLFAWCEHGTPLGHRCQWCRIAPDAPARPAQTGWECPRCHRTWNPSVLSCHHCPQPPASAESDPGPVEIGGCP